MDPEAVEDHAYCLRSARNRLAHEEDDLQGVSWKDLAAAFASAKALAAGARCAFATTNLVRLRRQCEEHAQSKELRRQGQPTRVSIAALTPELADEGPPPFLAQAGAGQERKCREWYADNANEWGNGPLQLRTREAETPLAGGDGAVEPWQPRILARGAAAPSEGEKAGPGPFYLPPYYQYLHRPCYLMFSAAKGQKAPLLSLPPSPPPPPPSAPLPAPEPRTPHPSLPSSPGVPPPCRTSAAGGRRRPG